MNEQLKKAALEWRWAPSVKALQALRGVHTPLMDHFCFGGDTAIIRLHGPNRTDIEEVTGGKWGEIVDPRDDDIEIGLQRCSPISNPPFFSMSTTISKVLLRGRYQKFWDACLSNPCSSI